MNRIENIKRLVINNGTTDNRKLIALVMHEMGATYQAIGEVLELSRQRAEVIVKTEKAKNG